MSLANHYGGTLRSDVDPRAPGSKYLDVGLGRKYPGGVPYLTNKILNEKEVNKTPGAKANGAVRATVHTRTRDQNYINVDQFAFMDVSNYDRPVLINLQTLNWMLLNDLPDAKNNPVLDGGNDNLLKEYTNNDGDISSVRDQVEKSYIMDRFQLYGVVVNRDVDNDDGTSIERIARTFTVTVKNVCHVCDYFSTHRNVLKKYNSCYFILKKIKITEDMRWENRLTATNSTMSKQAPTYTLGKYKWQIIPYHNSDNTLQLQHTRWMDDNGVEHNGGMWRLGKIHEYADICIPSTFSKRIDNSVVARDITEMHGRGRITPIHFYLKIEKFY